MKQIVRLPTIIALGLVAGVFLFAEDSPVSIHLELGKDTLALAEPTLLFVEVRNNQLNPLLIRNQHLHPAFGFRLTVISLDGEEWPYRASTAHGHPGEDARVNYKLGCGESVTGEVFVWWTRYTPSVFERSLEKLPSGTYKLAARYNIRYIDNGKLMHSYIYSDTVEFVFQPLENSNLPALQIMDSLEHPFRMMFSSRDTTALINLTKTKTPYSEGAWAQLIGSAWNGFIPLVKGKALFEAIYPGSVFTPFLLQQQLWTYVRENKLHSQPSHDHNAPAPDLDYVGETLLLEWSKVSPRDLGVLRFTEPEKFISWSTVLEMTKD